MGTGGKVKVGGCKKEKNVFVCGWGKEGRRMSAGSSIRLGESSGKTFGKRTSPPRHHCGVARFHQSPNRKSDFFFFLPPNGSLLLLAVCAVETLDGLQRFVAVVVKAEKSLRC